MNHDGGTEPIFQRSVFNFFSLFLNIWLPTCPPSTFDMIACMRNHLGNLYVFEINF